MKHNKIMNIKQFCKKYGVSRSTLYKLFQKGLGPGLLITEGIKGISKKEAERWIKSMESKPNSNTPAIAESETPDTYAANDNAPSKSVGLKPASPVSNKKRLSFIGIRPKSAKAK